MTRVGSQRHSKKKREGGTVSVEISIAQFTLWLTLRKGNLPRITDSARTAQWTLRHQYKSQSLNAAQESVRCLS